jgi:hypothetical protein
MGKKGKLKKRIKYGIIENKKSMLWIEMEKI